MHGELLAVVSVDERQPVRCQAPGCGRGVFRRVHVIRLDGNALGVYGADCYSRLFGARVSTAPRYGGGAGRELTPEERQQLVHNTEAFIAQFERDHQAQVQREQMRQSQHDKLTASSQQRQAQREAEAARRRPLTDAELAPVLHQAKAAVKAKFPASDPDAPGWRGLVLQEARKMLGR